MLKEGTENISWIEKELEGCQFKDSRHEKRFHK
jgi:Transposase DNA-binding